MTLFDVFRPQQRSSEGDNPWYSVGYRSSFPDIDPASPGTLSDRIYCQSSDATESIPAVVSLPVCKILQFDTITSKILTPSEAADQERLDNQVLVFQYRGKFHAVEHQCPHSSFPLSRGRVSDIEDFGIVLSAELTCPKHGWAFDLFTGQSDRGSYQLKIWEVQLRHSGDGTDDEEVWIRKKVRQRQG